MMTRKASILTLQYFELVYDPWLKIVYSGIFMLLTGTIFLFVAGHVRKSIEEEELEEIKSDKIKA